MVKASGFTLKDFSQFNGHIRTWLVQVNITMYAVGYLSALFWILERFFFITKNTGLIIVNSLKQKKLTFNFFVNRNWKKLTDSRKRVKTLGDNRKSHQQIKTLN